MVCSFVLPLSSVSSNRWGRQEGRKGGRKEAEEEENLLYIVLI